MTQQAPPYIQLSLNIYTNQNWSFINATHPLTVHSHSHVPAITKNLYFRCIYDFTC